MSGTALIRKVTVITFLVCLCNFVWRWYQWVVRIQKDSEEHNVSVCTFGPPTHINARFYIGLFLLLALIGCHLKGLKSTVLNVVGLTGSVVVYILWWQYIFRMTENAGTTPDGVPHFAYLAGGSVWDIAISLAIGWLVIMNVGNAALASFRLQTPD